jgi:hypothetical protein
VWSFFIFGKKEGSFVGEIPSQPFFNSSAEGDWSKNELVTALAPAARRFGFVCIRSNCSSITPYNHFNRKNSFWRWDAQVNRKIAPVAAEEEEEEEEEKGEGKAEGIVTAAGER